MEKSGKEITRRRSWIAEFNLLKKQNIFSMRCCGI
jgi:hypothetical protein